MPAYDYECEQCSARFEQRRSFDDESEARCPRCQGKAHRIFSPVPIIFNGPGFYATDSKRNGPESKDPKTASSSSGNADR